DFKQLDVMNIDGSGRKKIFGPDAEDVFSLSWSRSGDRIAFAHGAVNKPERKVDIETVAPVGSGYKALTGNAGNNGFPSFSPDGQWVVFTSFRAGYSAEMVSLPLTGLEAGELFVVRLDGAGLLRLTHNGFGDGTPAWSAVSNVKPSKEGKKVTAD